MKINRVLISIVLLLILGIFGYGYSFKKAPQSVSAISTDNLLAISWQNAFCETHPKRRECRNVKPDHYSASHFTLHGLWPQPRHKINCPTKERKIYLEKSLYQRLLKVMPAAKSGLHRHEWKKHGSCYGKPAKAYFEDAISLTEQINTSAVRDLFARNSGKRVTLQQVRLAFNKAFGPGAGRRVKMICKDGLITELWIRLKGKITPDTSLSSLLKKAPVVTGGCQEGLVDAPGLQRRGRH
ncbi:MAG: hypothetical protein B6D59_00115 [Campylobacteraceae bacterium 4484_4]|nr:MAG: hypothetical protein B6D59_00115 [Campylobacteraceae bacterium 4484_4]